MWFFRRKKINRPKTILGYQWPVRTPAIFSRLLVRLVACLHRAETRLSQRQRITAVTVFCLLGSGLYLNHLYHGLLGQHYTGAHFSQPSHVTIPIAPHLSDSAPPLSLTPLRRNPAENHSPSDSVTP